MSAINEVRQALQTEKNNRAEYHKLRLARVRNRRPEPGALAVFLRSFSLMNRSGVNMYSALLMLGLQSEDQQIQLASTEMAHEIAKGQRLSLAMSLHPHVFSSFQIALVQVAERSGNLDEILIKLAEYEEKASNTARKVKSALTYPAFIFIVCMTMLIFAPPFLFSGIFPLLKSTGQELPLITKLVIGASEQVRNPFFVVGLAGLGYLVGMYFIHLFTHPLKKIGAYRKLLRTPVLGPLLLVVAVARFTRSLGVQLSSGANILDSLALAGQASQNPVLQESIPKAIEGMRNGRALSRVLKETEFFPGMVLHLTRVGEETGELADLLNITANWFDDEVDHRIEALAACVEPLVMMIMGGCVGVIVIALLLPLTNLVANL
ncbi:MAG: type II secretion system F family protein [Vulcanimicrobiota bacterium]